MRNIIEQLKQSIEADGWETIDNFKSSFLEFEGKSLMLELLNNSNIRYSDMSMIFLKIPEIWKDFSLEDWKYIIRNVTRPKNYRVLFDDTPHFEDVKFLYNWIGIDSIDLYKSDNELPLENKQILDSVLPSFLFDHIQSGDNEEDFKDGTFGDYKHFLNMKNRLLSQGAKEKQ